jgi:hypothetical protein
VIAACLKWTAPLGDESDDRFAGVSPADLAALEVALRLVNWTWCRRLLDGWSGATALFVLDPTFGAQVFHHCRYLDRLHSVGSSQNNHAIAEAVGLLVGASEVPWFPQSVRWQQHGAERLLEVVRSNVHAGGLDRELATDYHGFVLELVTVAAVNATIHRRGEGAELWATAAEMTRAAACLTDPWGRPARQGDTDRGRVLVVQDDRRDLDRWTSLLRRDSLRDAVLARLGEGREPERAPVDLARVVDDTVNDARAAAPARSRSSARRPGTAARPTSRVPAGPAGRRLLRWAA